jgi:acetyltransferase-like isoleucine patch superfamily enzyme
MLSFSRFISYILYVKYYVRVFFQFGLVIPKYYIDRSVKLFGLRNISIGIDTQILDRSILNTFPNPYGSPFRLKFAKGNILIGDRTKIKNDVKIYTYNGVVHIGDNCTINPFSVLYGHGGIQIGSNTLIAAGTIIVASNHNYKRRDICVAQQGITAKGIKIGDDVWIGANCTILDGSIIPDGVVIGSNSTVRGTLNPYSIYVGSPAVKISERNG